VFTRVRQLSLSWAIWIHSTPLHTLSLISILIISSHPRLGLPNGLLLTKILLGHNFSSPCRPFTAPPSHSLSLLLTPWRPSHLTPTEWLLCPQHTSLHCGYATLAQITVVCSLGFEILCFYCHTVHWCDDMGCRNGFGGRSGLCEGAMSFLGCLMVFHCPSFFMGCSIGRTDRPFVKQHQESALDLGVRCIMYLPCLLHYWHKPRRRAIKTRLFFISFREVDIFYLNRFLYLSFAFSYILSLYFDLEWILCITEKINSQNKTYLNF
jgi:hypothetical protein